MYNSRVVMGEPKCGMCGDRAGGAMMGDGELCDVINVHLPLRAVLRLIAMRDDVQ